MSLILDGWSCARRARKECEFGHVHFHSPSVYGAVGPLAGIIHDGSRTSEWDAQTAGVALFELKVRTVWQLERDGCLAGRSLLSLDVFEQAMLPLFTMRNV